MPRPQANVRTVMGVEVEARSKVAWRDRWGWGSIVVVREEREREVMEEMLGMMWERERGWGSTASMREREGKRWASQATRAVKSPMLAPTSRIEATEERRERTAERREEERREAVKYESWIKIS